MMMMMIMRKSNSKEIQTIHINVHAGVNLIKLLQK